MAVGHGELDDEMFAALVCEKMGWTYEEFLDAPYWLIETLKIKWNCEAQELEKHLKK